MKVNREDFYKILDVVKVGLSRSKSLEGMLYFQFTGDSVMAYNNQILITYKFKTDFSCFVHADNLMKAISKLKDDEIDISLRDDKFLIKAKNTQLQLATIEDTEISDRTDSIIKAIKECKWYSMPKNFVECAKLCKFAASKQESDAALQCISINNTDMLASDNNRIAHAVLSKKMKPMMLKAEFVPVITGLDIDKYDVSKAWIHFKEKNENFILSVRRIMGNYPNFDQILTSVSGETITLSDDLVRGLDVSEIFIDEFNSSVNLAFSKGKCIVTTSSDAGEMKYRSKTDYSGEEFNFSVSPEFLLEMLNHSTTLKHDKDKISIKSGDFKIVTALFGE